MVVTLEVGLEVGFEQTVLGMLLASNTAHTRTGSTRLGAAGSVRGLWDVMGA